MRRNYVAGVAWLFLIVELATPFAAEVLFPEWMGKLGPGGPYLAAFWIAACSLLGIITATAAVVLSYHGFHGRVVSYVALTAHLAIGTIPFLSIVRLVVGLY